ncbi:glycoside hydrolase family 128 protein [Lepidopterella palustris CBS 459.81]|uniref:Glycoside hydrolase family 128 protein n=1 Tax=Lepidopterella palustris CBS 459.81 TaxID=1314670 RepID=A0A8E2EJS6_9PEZI|nr:glycoside hydrolase family 128 protein [Lepidopterella palustris CBS 459.81]
MTGSPASVLAADVSTGACSQSTIYVTATSAVTVTVTPGAASSSSAAAPGSLYAAGGSSYAAGGSSYAASSSAVSYDYAPPSSSSDVAAEAYTSLTTFYGAQYPHSASSSAVAAVPSAAPSSLSALAYTPPAGYSYPAAVSSSGSTTSSTITSPTPAAYTSAAPVSSSAAYSSSAAASSAAPVSPSNGKRGVAYNDASLTSCFEGNSKITWGYNWGQTSAGLPSAFEYVPMLWGMGDIFISGWEANWKAALTAGSTAFLCFNEPDLSTQSNLSPTAAAAGYLTHMQPIKVAQSSVRLGSPAVTNGANGMGIDWLVAFQSACTGCDIDFVAVHWYESATNIQYFKDHITEAHTRTGKPVWVTEFGASGSDAEISAFLEDVLPWMDSQGFVERYSYFMVSNGLLVSGGSPSSYGNTYATV